MGALYYSDDRLPAAELGDATRALRNKEQGIEDLLVEIFPGWRPMVPRLRGWRYSLPDGLDIYEAVDSKVAADALHRAGFVRVTAHAHESNSRCTFCESRFPPSRSSGKVAVVPAPVTPAAVASAEFDDVGPIEPQPSRPPSAPILPT